MLTVRLFQSRSAYKLLYHHSNVIFYLTLTQNYSQMGPYDCLHTLSVRHRARLLDYTSEITYTNSRCGLVLPHCRHEGRVGGQVLLQTPTNLAYIINDRRGRTLLKNTHQRSAGTAYSPTWKNNLNCTTTSRTVRP